MINYIDLFAGAGGLSEGFMQEGFNPIAHIEMNPNAANTLKTRSCYYYLKANNKLDSYYSYLKKEISREQLYSLVPNDILDRIFETAISNKSISSIFKSIDGILNNSIKQEIDIIIGGPPCQAYSLIGRAVKDDKMANDPRNYLYKLYCQFLTKYNPKMFVFENVPGLLTANKGEYFKDIQNSFRTAGYSVEWKELNSKDYGVLQNRRRIVIIGWRNDTRYHYPLLIKSVHNYVVYDLLNDLPSIQAGSSSSNYNSYITDYLRKYNIREEKDILTLHFARNNNARDKEIYRMAICYWNDNHRRLKYIDLPDALKTHKNITSFLDRFKVVEGDMAYCHTMLAHIAKDGHYFIHPDINQTRSITVREAARIQSFPDNYFFEGSRTAAFTQIGNAVPPLMARAIAKGIKKLFEEG